MAHGPSIPIQERKVALVRITSTWDFTVKHLEMDPLWLRSSYLKVGEMDLGTLWMCTSTKLWFLDVSGIHYEAGGESFKCLIL